MTDTACAGPETLASSDSSPLPWPAQRRNLILFAACTALQYFAAPVGYVGVTQASLCHELGSTDAVANLPETVYLAITVSPVILAWLVPYVSWLKRNLVTCYGVAAASQAAVAAALLAPLPDGVKTAAVIVQAGLAGITVPSAIAFLWEITGRGAAESRRGLALSLAFGVGPLFAVVGSLGQQLILKGTLGPVTLTGLNFPRNFAVLYAVAAPTMLLAAFLSSQFIVPLPEQEVVRQPFVHAVCGGLWEFLRNPVLRTATIVTILVYTGNTITSNLNLYSREVFGEAPMLHAGNQNAIRFAFKMAAGLVLGWLLNRTNPKVGLLATAVTFVASVAWALVATANTYLLVFGIYGAGELVGVYAPNYILSASRKEDMRRNMAFVTMMMAPAAPAGYLFGAVVDFAKARAWTAWGMNSSALGFRTSFALCALLMLSGIVLAAARLPKQPRVRAE